MRGMLMSAVLAVILLAAGVHARTDGLQASQAVPYVTRCPSATRQLGGVPRMATRLRAAALATSVWQAAV